MKICTSSRHTARHCHLVTTASTSLTAVTAATSTCYIFILPSRDILAFCGSCVNINNFAAAHCSCHVSVAVSGVTQLPGLSSRSLLTLTIPARWWARVQHWWPPPGVPTRPVPVSRLRTTTTLSKPSTNPRLVVSVAVVCRTGSGAGAEQRADKTVWPPVYVPSATTDVWTGGA